jgi:hypothetical protein
VGNACCVSDGEFLGPPVSPSVGKALNRLFTGAVSIGQRNTSLIQGGRGGGEVSPADAAGHDAIGNGLRGSYRVCADNALSCFSASSYDGLISSA